MARYRVPVQIYRGVGTPIPQLPPLKEHQVRCVCGKPVSVVNGRIRRHQTLHSKVSCVYGGNEVDLRANSLE